MRGTQGQARAGRRAAGDRSPGRHPVDEARVRARLSSLAADRAALRSVSVGSWAGTALVEFTEGSLLQLEEQGRGDLVQLARALDGEGGQARQARLQGFRPLLERGAYMLSFRAGAGKVLVAARVRLVEDGARRPERPAASEPAR